jgi:hypothetical protein
MPEYLFIDPDSPDEIISVHQKINDEHVFEVDGKKCERVFTVPQASIDSQIDPFSKRQFLEKTSDGGTMGEMWDRSAEMSEKRAAQNGGIDPVKQKHFLNYSSKRKGMKHQDDPSKSPDISI